MMAFVMGDQYLNIITTVTAAAVIGAFGVAIKMQVKLGRLDVRVGELEDRTRNTEPLTKSDRSSLIDSLKELRRQNGDIVVKFNELCADVAYMKGRIAGHDEETG